MQLSFSAIVILLAFGVKYASAGKHHDLVCVRAEPGNRSEVATEATGCACNFLKSKGECSDCTIYEETCHSDAKLLDGDKFKRACTDQCTNYLATGSSAPPV
ncbi:hypothetical protein PgNI_05137 [Pyricularia grisea]|uniref:Uncharacterized protein n=1 Tax=Pyricularia grisea TaxID=148305 RepID=A0A6P8B5T0_PYRGI|nr:hypothetical protein PgNI_05137 [Pyricularia grisea]TLD10633.1 hypothetical protein PgNI_05137 [Pyricularia grisea]